MRVVITYVPGLVFLAKPRDGQMTGRRWAPVRLYALQRLMSRKFRNGEREVCRGEAICRSQ